LKRKINQEEAILAFHKTSRDILGVRRVDE